MGDIRIRLTLIYGHPIYTFRSNANGPGEVAEWPKAPVC